MVCKADKLFQQYACLQRSAISGKPAEVGHHIIHRRYNLLRWDYRNCLPCTNKEHTAIHNGNWEFFKDNANLYKMAYERELETRMEVLRFLKNIEFKDVLVRAGINERDFEKAKEFELKQKIKELI